MNGFVQLLGWLLLTLTFIGSFRLSRSLSPSSTVLYPGLIASTITAIFVIIVDVIILVTGVLAITIPVLLVVQRLTGFNTPIDASLPALRGRTTSDDTGRDHSDVPDRRPVLDVVGRLWDHIEQHVYHRDSQDPAQIEITDPGDDWDDNWPDDEFEQR